MYVAMYVRTNEGERMCRPRDKYRDRAGSCGSSPCVAPFSLRPRRGVPKKKKNTKIRRRREQLRIIRPTAKIDTWRFHILLRFVVVDCGLYRESSIIRDDDGVLFKIILATFERSSRVTQGLFFIPLMNMRENMFLTLYDIFSPDDESRVGHALWDRSAITYE